MALTAEVRTRYPGAQPFPDNDLARRTFFGRGSASIALTDQILASRLVVVYAKSGLGKTSLLNAGVAPLLREAASVPLFTRVNDTSRGPMVSVLEGIRAEAERQQVEYVPGNAGSLWAFFKSVEFWRGDLLLTPVLVLDQFEELFTLQPETDRDAFLAELGYLVRGVPPPSVAVDDSGASITAPPIRIVLSLREDFLGILEEAAERIPQIMDHRFRLTPLSSETAAQAITGPAAIQHPDLVTRPFRLDPELVNAILDYLSKSTAGTHSPKSRYVEPFHLQLICQRIEQIVTSRQSASSQEIMLRLDDLGGMAALTDTLAQFYSDAVQSVPEKHLRPAVRRMCEQFLISPEGRRLSLEDWELQRQLGLSSPTLAHLVERRLLRTDRRSDSTYYELSHDALVEPVLASRRIQVLAMGWAQLVAGWTILIVMGLTIGACLLMLVGEREKDAATDRAAVILVTLAGVVGSYGIRFVRTGKRTRKRYRRRAAGAAEEALPTLRPLKDRLAGWPMVVFGFALSGLSIFYLLVEVAVYGSLPFTHEATPRWLAWMGAGAPGLFQSIHDHPFKEAARTTLEIGVTIISGWILLRAGRRRLWPESYRLHLNDARVTGLDERAALRSAVLRLIGGVALFAVPVDGILVLRHCMEMQGSLPRWAVGALIYYDLEVACSNVVKSRWVGLDWGLGLFFFLSSFLAVGLFFTGVRGLQRALVRWRHVFTAF